MSELVSEGLRVQADNEPDLAATEHTKRYSGAGTSLWDAVDEVLIGREVESRCRRGSFCLTGNGPKITHSDRMRNREPTSDISGQPSLLIGSFFEVITGRAAQETLRVGDCVRLGDV